MTILRLPLSLQAKNRVNDLSMRAAVASLDPVWQKVQPVVTGMRSSEARGYIRVRASAIVRLNCLSLLRDHPSLARWCDDVTHRATQTVVDRLTERVEELQTRQQQATAFAPALQRAA